MTECMQCGGDFPEYDLIEAFEGHSVCRGCFVEYDMNAIASYMYKPQPVFYGETVYGRFYGLEIECMNGNYPRTIAGLVSYCSEEIYTKADGSVPGGFEMVTHPCSLEYHESMDYEKVFGICEKHGFKSHDASQSCGLHIHISRDSFFSNAAIGGFIYLFHKFKPQMVKFSRRKEYDLNRWAKFYDHVSMDAFFGDIYNACMQFNRMERYVAVNLRNTHTVEVRIFRGTLKRDTVVATIQLIDLFMEIVTTMRESEIRSLTWNDIKELAKKKELKEYLEKRRL